MLASSLTPDNLEFIRHCSKVITEHFMLRVLTLSFIWPPLDPSITPQDIGIAGETDRKWLTFIDYAVELTHLRILCSFLISRMRRITYAKVSVYQTFFSVPNTM